jgi:hypothetical protein
LGSFAELKKVDRGIREKESKHKALDGTALKEVHGQEDNLVKVIEKKLKELEKLEKLLEEGGELSKVYAEAFRLSGFDWIADQLEEYENHSLLADRNNLGYLHVPLVNIKRMLHYIKDSYQILTLEFIREVYMFKERNKKAHEEGREKLSPEAIENLDKRVLTILEEWRKKL